MKALLPLLLLAALPAYSAPITQVQTCLDVPPIASPSGYGLCKKAGCGPTYNTDRVRSTDPRSTTGGQVYEAWATLAPTRLVAACIDGKFAAQWVSKSVVVINPPPPPVVVTPPPPPPPPPFTQVVSLDWTAPTANVDGTALTDLTGYTIYQGGPQATLNKVATVNAALTTYLSGPLPIGSYTFAVAAVSKSSGEGLKSAIVTVTIAAPTSVKAAAPTGLRWTPRPPGV